MRNRFLLAGAALLVPATLAAAMMPLAFQPGSRVWVQGSSTARSYRCQSTQVEGVVQAPTAELAHLNEVTGARVTVPVATLDCANRTMNGHMRTALKAADYPTLSLQLSSATVARVADGSTTRMTGTLTIAGTTRPVNIEGTVTSEGGQLRVRGTEPVVMTEYGVRPPSLMLGTMRVHPNATIGFDILLKP